MQQSPATRECDAKGRLRVEEVKGGRASRSGAQPQASTERVSTRRSYTLDAHVAPQPVGGVQGMFTPAPLPFGENGVPRGCASWSSPQGREAETEPSGKMECNEHRSLPSFFS